MKGRERTGRAYIPGRVPIEVMMAVLGGGPRFEIIRFLAGFGEAASGAIADRLELAFNTISHHLAILCEHHIVEVEVRGARRIYRLSRMLRARPSGSGVVLRASCSGEAVTFRLASPAAECSERVDRGQPLLRTPEERRIDVVSQTSRFGEVGRANQGTTPVVDRH